MPGGCLTSLPSFHSMKNSIDNHVLREELIRHGFQDITSVNRSTKSWRLKHPAMTHWVSVKLAADPSRAMTSDPLVLHPDDADRLKSAMPLPGVSVGDKPYKGSSTKYDGVPGWAFSVESVDALGRALGVLMPGGSASA